MKHPIENLLERIGTRKEIAEACGVEEIAVYRWLKSGRVPAWHLRKIMAVASDNNSNVTPDDLIAALEPQASQRAEASQ